MERLSAALAVAALAVAAAPAGAFGATFPEQPGTHPQTACTTVTTNPGTGATGRAGEVISPTAGAIVTELVNDACFGG